MWNVKRFNTASTFDLYLYCLFQTVSVHYLIVGPFVLHTGQHHMKQIDKINKELQSKGTQRLHQIDKEWNENGFLLIQTNLGVISPLNQAPFNLEFGRYLWSKNSKISTYFKWAISKHEKNSPRFPIRPVRPMRWTYSSTSLGRSKFMTCFTCGISKPRAATY